MFIGVGCGVVGQLFVGFWLVVSWLLVSWLLVGSHFSVSCLSLVLQFVGGLLVGRQVFIWLFLGSCQGVVRCLFSGSGVIWCHLVIFGQLSA